MQISLTNEMILALVYYQANSTVCTPSWEAMSCSASQEIPCLFWNTLSFIIHSLDPASGSYPEPD
jgi:hypothetical protein